MTLTWCLTSLWKRSKINLVRRILFYEHMGCHSSWEFSACFSLPPVLTMPFLSEKRFAGWGICVATLQKLQGLLIKKFVTSWSLTQNYVFLKQGSSLCLASSSLRSNIWKILEFCIKIFQVPTWRTSSPGIDSWVTVSKNADVWKVFKFSSGRWTSHDTHFQKPKDLVCTKN